MSIKNRIGKLEKAMPVKGAQVVAVYQDQETGLYVSLNGNPVPDSLEGLIVVPKPLPIEEWTAAAIRQQAELTGACGGNYGP